MPSAPATTSTYFNPRTPRGVRRQRVCTISMGNRNFNPRTPRGVRHGGDCLNINDKLFQSTHPARGATVRGGRPGSHRKNFNPRTPRGVRLLQEQEAELEQVFQSTHPARGATHRHIQGRQYSKISIHAPREGCDGECYQYRDGVYVISIHAPREGCDGLSSFW